MADREQLIKEIKTLSDAIRVKTRDLKLGISERHKYLESTFKPVVDPLQEISRTLDRSSPEIDVEEIIPSVEDYGEKETSDGVWTEEEEVEEEGFQRNKSLCRI